MTIRRQDRDVLRELGHRKAEIGHLPVQKETAALWRRLNALQPVRPLVWINEIPWHEMNVDDELTLRTEDPFLQSIETTLRQELYQWNHMRGDMVIDPVVVCPYVFENSGFGMDGGGRRPEMQFGAAHYEPIMKTEEDIYRIQVPKITADWETTEAHYRMLCEIFDGVIAVEKRGITQGGAAPWDTLIRWWGTDNFFTDMIDRPDFVHKGIGHMLDCYLAMLDQWEAQKLLTVDNNNHRVGTGGLGITDELPPADYDPERVRPMDLWGNSMGQIFSEVSPAMHDEFCLQYEIRWLERFGLNCYGCCEPLHKKVDIARAIPRLRRISMSPWVDLDEAAEKVGTDLVFSRKPNPAVLAGTRWNADHARAELERDMEKIRGCRVEFIMKDIHTVCKEPQRLWAWADVAMDVVRRHEPVATA